MNIQFTPIQNNLRAVINLSLQRALLCEVASNLRMVAADWDDANNKILLFFYYDKTISDENLESASSVAGEVAGDFDEETQVLEKNILLDFPEQLPIHMSHVYRRKE